MEKDSAGPAKKDGQEALTPPSVSLHVPMGVTIATSITSVPSATNTMVITKFGDQETTVILNASTDHC
jgi:hypothetical protein